MGTKLYMLTYNIPTLFVIIMMEVFFLLTWCNERIEKAYFFVRFRPRSLDFVRPYLRDVQCQASSSAGEYFYISLVPTPRVKICQVCCVCNLAGWVGKTLFVTFEVKNLSREIGVRNLLRCALSVTCTKHRGGCAACAAPRPARSWLGWAWAACLCTCMISAGMVQRLVCECE